MKRSPQQDILEPDVYDVLAATWVFANNDENPIVTYEGIRHRLNLSSAFDIQGLVKSRGDLFRRGVPSHRLRAWKEQLQAGKHLPGWIRDITEEGLRTKAIDELTPDAVFRSQFRAQSDAPRSSLEIIDWGLQHIDRLRRARYEQREKSAKSWQMWLVFFVGLLSIAATIVVALLKHP